MIFRGWQKTSLIEYPGKISTVLFTGGCNFRCPFCYNAKLVLAPETLHPITEDDVFSMLRQRKGMYQAVMVSGGEPTLDSSLAAFYREVKSLGLLAGIETNGTNPGMLKELIGEKLVDFIAMDIKAPLFFEKYQRATGMKDRSLFERVRESVDIVKKSGVDYEFRTTVVPAVHSREDIIEIARDLRGSKKYVIQQFYPEKDLIDKEKAGRESYPDSVLEDIKNEISGNFSSCETRNLRA